MLLSYIPFMLIVPTHENFCIATLSLKYPEKLVLNLQQQIWYAKYKHYIFIPFNTFDRNSRQKKIKNIKPYFSTQSRRMQKKNSICNHTGSKHKVGYRTMCHFWYVDFIKFLSNCSFVLRVDSDIRLLPDQNDPFSKLPKTLAPVEWQRKMDKKEVIYGMVDVFKRMNPEISYWESPYTNVMLVNMSWIQSAKVQSIVRIVNKTNCIFHNRWGDLPLWGATLKILKETKEYLNLSYHHKSHYNRLVHI